MRGDLETEQNCDILTPPNSYGYSSISFPFSWAAQPGAWGPSLYWDRVLIPASSLPLIRTSCRRGYMIIRHPPTSCERHICTQFNPSTVKVAPDPLISSTGCTCYLHRCISSFDSLAGVNMLHKEASITIFCVFGLNPGLLGSIGEHTNPMPSLVSWRP